MKKRLKDMEDRVARAIIMPHQRFKKDEDLGIDKI